GGDPRDMPSILFVPLPGFAAAARLDLELSAIRSHPASAELAHRAVVLSYWTLPELRRKIEELRPTVIHFCGAAPLPRGLWSDTDSHLAQRWGADTLEELLAAGQGAIRCVVLSGCYLDDQAIAIARHVDHVIGMRPPIADPAAVAFSLAFYHALGSGA